MALNVHSDDMAPDPDVHWDGVILNRSVLHDDGALNMDIYHDDAVLNLVVLHENEALDLNFLHDGTVLNLDVFHDVAFLALDVDLEAELTMGITPNKKGVNAFGYVERILNQDDESRYHPGILFYYSWFMITPFQ